MGKGKWSRREIATLSETEALEIARHDCKLPGTYLATLGPSAVKSAVYSSLRERGLTEFEVKKSDFDY